MITTALVMILIGVIALIFGLLGFALQLIVPVAALAIIVWLSLYLYHYFKRRL